MRHEICVELCSGQAITPGQRGVPLFDRENASTVAFATGIACSQCPANATR
jgi:hypothetical protein